jgi:hypothetical protein
MISCLVISREKMATFLESICEEISVAFVRRSYGRQTVVSYVGPRSGERSYDSNFLADAKPSGDVTGDVEGKYSLSHAWPRRDHHQVARRETGQQVVKSFEARRDAE